LPGAPGDLYQHAADDATILPRPRPIRSLPFLAQYLAQEIIGPEDPAPRWRERDGAYRIAGGGTPVQRLRIDA
jgi:hypothetical protein